MPTEPWPAKRHVWQMFARVAVVSAVSDARRGEHLRFVLGAVSGPTRLSNAEIGERAIGRA